VHCRHAARPTASPSPTPANPSPHPPGVRFQTLYTESNGAGAAPASPSAGDGSAAAAAASAAEQVFNMLDMGLFLHANGLEGAIGARPAEATVVLAGVSGGLASQIANELCFKGVARERLLFCDFF